MTAVDNPIAPVAPSAPPTVPDQAARLLAHVAGYVGHRTVAVGLRRGLIRALAEAGGPLSADDLAHRLGLDPFYAAVWCRGALAAGICERPPGAPAPDPAGLGGTYELAPHVATLLLDPAHPGYLGAIFPVLEQPEVFDGFEARLGTGARRWWDDCSPDWIAGVAGTGHPFYTRLVPAGLARIPGLAARLAEGGRIVDTACGAGAGLVRLAEAYPQCRIVGVDGDRQSLARAGHNLAEAGLAERCHLVHSPLEELALDAPAACVINNISMHECRDIDRVTANVRAALEPGGWFVVSDFPYPDTVEALRTVPGRVMSGIQFFEAQIDDQLLPRTRYDDLLDRHGFVDRGHLDLGPVHAVTYGRAPL